MWADAEEHVCMCCNFFRDLDESRWCTIMSFEMTGRCWKVLLPGMYRYLRCRSRLLLHHALLLSAFELFFVGRACERLTFFVFMLVADENALGQPMEFESDHDEA